MTFQPNRSENQILHTILAISKSTEILTEKDTPGEAFPKVLEELGQATSVSRVYIYKVISQSEDETVVRQIHEWINQDSNIPIDSVPSRNVPMIQSGYKRWVEKFEKNEAVYGLVKDFPESEFPMLSKQQICSICVFPLYVKSELYGFIGFDDCKSDRNWNTIEIETLKTAANIISSFLQIKKNEIALKQSEDLFRNIFLNSTIGLYRTTPEGEILMANPTILQKLGYDSLEDLQNRNLNDKKIKHSYDREEFLEKIYRDGYVNGFETTWTKKDGTRLYIRESSKIVRDDNGEILYFEGSIEDITEQKLTENSLVDNRELLKEAQKIGNIGNWEYDVLSKAIKWSEQVYHIFNRNIDEGPPSTLDEVIDCFTVESGLILKDLMSKALKEQKRFSSELQLKPINDETKVLFGVITPIIARNKVIKLRGIIQDITTLKKYEANMIKSQKLESVGLLAGGIAHDFNNLVTGILGNIVLAKIDMDSTDPAYFSLHEAETAAMIAKDLTAQLLTFSSGDKPVLKPTDIRNILIPSINMVIKNSNTLTEYYIDSDLAEVNVDPAQIRQVFYNLIINSEQAMPNGGKLKISAQNSEVDDQFELPLQHGTYVKITIEDEGVGISKKNLPKIFDPYFTTKQTGSGLGLATASAIIKKHQGYLLIDSVLGEGTKAEIYLPVIQEVQPERVDNIFDISDLEKVKGRVLVMDDEDFIRSLATRVLTKAGYYVLAVEDGESALLEYKKAYNSTKRFDVVLLDLTVINGLSGKETIAQLQTIDPNVKAIVCSGYVNDPVMSFYTQYGFKDVLPKPFKPEELVNVVSSLIKNNS